MRKKKRNWINSQVEHEFHKASELLQEESYLANESVNPSRLSKPKLYLSENRLLNFLIKLMEKIPTSLVILFFLKCLVIEVLRIIVTIPVTKSDQREKTRNKSKLLCVTHFISKSKDEYDEMYFGKLFDNYNANELSYFFINQTDLQDSEVTQYLKSSFQFDFRVSKKSSSLGETIKIILGQLKSAVKILRMPNFESWGLANYNLRAYFVIRDQFSRTAINNLLLTSSIISYVEDSEIEKVVITFEGNAYESCLYSAISRRFPGIVFILYQHAPVTKNHIGIKNQLGRVSNNATIGASGIVTAKTLEEFMGISKLQDIDIFGSTKFRFSESPDPNVLKKVCLIAPEGVLSAVEEMLDLALNLAGIMKDFHFIFRVHPVLRQHLEKMRDQLNEKPINFEFSTQSIEDDFSRSGACIYRGSSVGIEGAAFGVIPIFYSKANEKALDPISFENRDGMQTFEPDQVSAILRRLETLDTFIFTGMVKDLKVYNRAYFAPIKPLQR